MYMRYYFILGCLLLALTSTAQIKHPSKIKLEVKGMENKEVMLGYHFGKTQYISDTVMTDSKGRVTFDGERPRGIYLLVDADTKKYFEFLVVEPEVSLQCDFNDAVGTMKALRSKENALHYEYIAGLNKFREEVKPINEQLEKLKGKEDKTSIADREQLQAKLAVVDTKVVKFRKSFQEQHPNSFVAKFIRTSTDPIVEECPEGMESKECKTYQWRKYKAAYLKELDFNDQRMIYTPIYEQRMMYYLDKLCIQHPDTLIEEVNWIIGQLDKESKFTYQYVASTLLNKYVKSKVMGMDKVATNVANQCYCPDKAWWKPEDELKEFCEKYKVYGELVLGKEAPNLILRDTSETWHALHRFEKDFTILVFWDPGCGHCKELMGELKEFYKEYKAKGVGIFAVSTVHKNQEWLTYLRDNEFPADWIQVSDSPEYPDRFRSTYDIRNTPVVYVLDKDKKIIGKRIDPPAIKELIDFELGKK